MKQRLNFNLLMETVRQLGVWMVVLGVFSIWWVGAEHTSEYVKLGVICMGIAMMVAGSIREQDPESPRKSINRP